MEYTKRRRITVKIEDNSLLETYPHDLQLYNSPPTGEISMKDFQDLGIERRQVLRLVESVAQRADLKGLEEKKVALLAALKKDGLVLAAKLLNGQGCSSNTETELQARKRDHISHYILRSAYSQSSDLRRWFVNMEVEYFKMRFTSLNKEGVVKFMAVNNFNYQAIPQEEKDSLRENLHISTAKISSIDNVDFYRVPFEQVCDLIRNRRVYVRQGFAYIPVSDLISLFVSEFKSCLNKELEIAANNFKLIEDDERLSEYLKNLPNVFSEMTKIIWSNVAVPIESLDQLSKISYPVCMRVLHEALRTEHHLRNGGRIQYGLFIKGIGVTLEDSLRFWRTEFTKNMDIEKFEKSYAYSIRHTYGKEGRRLNYTPLGCGKIFTSAPGPGDKHGCPFRHMSSDELTKRLESFGFPASGVSEAVELAKEGSYNLACTKCFELTHKTLPERPIVHPNSYFSQSRDAINKAMGTTENSSVEAGNSEKKLQSGKFRTDGVASTPSRNTNDQSRNFGTPSRKFATPSRNPITPSRNPVTPTGNRLSSKIDSLNIEELLNSDELDELMNENL